MPVFEDEINDMTQAAIREVQDVFGIDEYVTEFPYGSGVGTYRTDIAGVDIDPSTLDERRQRFGRRRTDDGVDWKPLNTKWKYLYDYITCRDVAARVVADDDPDYEAVIKGQVPTGKFMREDYMDRTGYRSAAEIYNWLEANGYIEVAGWDFDAESGSVATPLKVIDVPFHGDQYAFELKPKDWRTALTQVSRATTGRPEHQYDDPPYQHHGGYADFQVVIMDADHVADAEDHADRFDDLGIGLASLDRDSLDVIVEPERKHPNTWSRNRLDLNERTLP